VKRDILTENQCINVLATEDTKDHKAGEQFFIYGPTGIVSHIYTL
jgi:hypothetical protein